ncbi:MAG: hypothetical protein CL823_06380 [Crocinitomicaceae bacterium]|nr:hypothetical protein [Crocinitomicaceae bacterium]
MKAPKLKSIFRNVRTEPKKFKFKSRHLPDVRDDWEERKRRIEYGLPSSFSFSKRRKSAKKVRRRALLRTMLIGALFVYLAYQLILWAETTEWGKYLEFIRENG